MAKQLPTKPEPAIDPRAWHGTDPIFDEEAICRMLKVQVNDDTLPILQNGCVQALIAMYDREGSREEFTAHASNCLALYGSISRLYILNSMRHLHSGEQLDAGSFINADNDLKSLVRKQAETVYDTMDRIRQQPTAEDPVH